MRIAVTGINGQVVTCLLERGKAAGHEVIALGRPELDLADPASVRRAIVGARPDVVVSAAAYTAVDKAESDAEMANAINVAGPAAVAEAARALQVPLIHLSTDYVFDGSLDRPYVEEDATGPTGIYGMSKLAGEEAVLRSYPENSVVLRVAWVYSPYGANFVKTMLRIADGRDEISVVSDQIGNPTSAFDIADGVLKVAANLLASDNSALRGVFHMTAAGKASWADFAEAIFEESAKRGGPSSNVQRITTAEYPTPAKRPENSLLECTKISQTHDVRLPLWQGSLEKVIEQLLVRTA